MGTGSKLSKVGCLLLLLGVFVTTFELQLYRMYAWAPNHLFLYDWTHCLEVLTQIGGGALLVASLLSQFFQNPYIGVLSVSAVYLLIVLLSFFVLKKFSFHADLLGWTFVPVGFLFLCVENDYYRFQGHIAFLMSVASLWGYLCMRIGKTLHNCLLGVAFIIVTYHLAGPFVWLLVVGACLYECRMDGRKTWLTVIYPLSVVIIGLVGVRLSWVESMEKAFLPAVYFDCPTTYFSPCYAGGAFLLIVLVAMILDKWGKERIFKSSILSLTGCFVALLCTGYMYQAVHSPLGYKIWKEQYHAEHGEWEEIVQMSDAMTRNYFICYLHLALAQQGKLPDSLPHYRVFEESELSTPSHVEKIRHSLLATTYYYWRDVDSACRAAMAANRATPGGCNPEQIKILIRTLLVKGEYEMADHYLCLLGKTLLYADWAKEHRRFLNDDEAVKCDSLLGNMFRSIPLQCGNQYQDVLKQRMKDILDAQPDNPILEQFYIAYLMLGHGG